MPKRKPKDAERSADLPHQWIERHFDRLAQFLYYDVITLDSWQYRRSQLVAVGEYHDIDEEWGRIHVGQEWGGEDVTAFFRTTIDIPDSHATDNAYLEMWLDGGEAQLTINGQHWQGLDWNRSLVPLGNYAYEKQLQIDIEAFIINFPYDERRNDDREYHCFERARLLKVDKTIESFLSDARFMLDAYMSYYHNDANYEIEQYLLHRLTEVCHRIGVNITTQEQATQIAERAHAQLKALMLENPAFKREGAINICAHSHLDIVYLWPIKETLRKNCRTITNMLSLMREYPEYRFTYSQPFLYEKLKDMYPAVYEEVKERIAEKRWEAIGAMYLEPDGNLPSGESMIRQILFGKQFFQDEFGIDAQTCWLPDVFGVMYTLPQILAKSGVKYFLTNKQNIWNDTNEFPYDTFRWRGLDGSDVIAHFPPTHFAQEFKPDNLRRHWRDFRERESIGSNLFIYGLADGGGGPTREMVASSMTSSQLPGIPKTQISFAEEYFKSLEEYRDTLPVWDDELYLEAHRGTYTTKGDLKWQNRKVEILYRDAEILSVFAQLYGADGQQDALNEGWKLVLLNQFHDTLPGTHRPEAVPDIKQDYADAFRIGEAVKLQAIDYLASLTDHSETNTDYDFMLFNTLSWERSTLVELPIVADANSVLLADGQAIPLQNYNEKTYCYPTELPAMGWIKASYTDTVYERADAVIFEDNRIESAYYTIDIDENGHLARIYDKQNKQEVLSDAGNVFQVFDDNPGRKFSAWDIAYHLEDYQHEVILKSPWQLVTNGALFAVFQSEWRVSQSIIRQEMWIFADDPRIVFHTNVTWNDQQKMLKVAFPLNVRTRTATFDLPFGHIERATHRNTSFEQARFEVCGHKWADMSQGNYGVALLNDSKYGYDARENVLRLTLLRSPIRPDGQSDVGEHQFSYALHPHAGTWRQAQIDRSGYDFNMPVITASMNASGEKQPISIPNIQSIVNIEESHVIVEALKQAESSDGFILRIFDSHGANNEVQITSSATVKSVNETNLIEQDATPIVHDKNAFKSAFTPYEIKTHHLHLSFEPIIPSNED